MAELTGKKTKHGRPIYVDKEGREYSEKQVTIPFDRDANGKPLPNTRWINVPSVIDGGKIISSEDDLYRIYKNNKWKDIIGNKRDLKKLYKSAEEAAKASATHSKSLDKGQTK